MPTYYDDFDATKNYTRIKFNAGKPLQSRELNNLQDQVAYDLKGVADYGLSDGQIVGGCQITISGTTVTIGAGRVYAAGRVWTAPQQNVTITGSGRETIGLLITGTTIAATSDSTLYDPAVGVDGSGLAGADRLQQVGSWALNNVSAYTVFTLVNGVPSITPAASTYDSSLLALLARRDFDTHGSFLIRGMGMSVQQTPTDNSKLDVLVEAGKAHVAGSEVELPAATRVTINKPSTTTQIFDEPHTAIGVKGHHGLSPGSFFSPFATFTQGVVSVDAVTSPTSTTNTLTRGGTYPGTDALSPTPVASITSVVQGGTTYVQNTDYALSGNNVSWLGGGAHPTAGTTYTVTYIYIYTLTRSTSTKTTGSQTATRSTGFAVDVLSDPGSATYAVDGQATQIVSVQSIIQGGTTYVQGTDYIAGNLITVLDGSDNPISGQLDPLCNAQFAVYWLPGGAKPADGSSYTAAYTYWAASTADYTAYNSYNSPADVAPALRNLVQLRDHAAWTNPPIVGNLLNVSYTSYIPRTDLVFIDKNGTLTVAPGSGTQPSVPPTSAADVLPLAQIAISADAQSVKITPTDLQRMTMADLRKLETRVDEDEYNQAILFLATAAQHRDFTAAPIGIFVDPFQDTSHADTFTNFTCAIDPLNQVLRPGYSELLYDVAAAPGVNGGATTAVVANALYTLPRTTTVIPMQAHATNTIALNPLGAYTHVAHIRFTPSHDNWHDPKQTTSQAWAPNAVYGRGTFWAATDLPGQDDNLGITVYDDSANSRVQQDRKVRDLAKRYNGAVDAHFMRRRTITINGSKFTANADNLAATFDGIAVPLTAVSPSTTGTTTGTIKADSHGKIKATFVIPANEPAGVRSVTITNGTDSATARYSANGRGRGHEPSTHRWNLPADPVAQKFRPPADGWYSGATLAFAAVSVTADAAVRVQLRPIDASGFPSRNVIAECLVENPTPVASIDGSVLTQAIFLDPVYLQANVDYALVVISDDTAYRLYYAETGQNDLATGQRVGQNPYVNGVLFYSQNASTWATDPNGDLTFGLIQANFSSTTATLQFVNITGWTGGAFYLGTNQTTPPNTSIAWQYSTDSGSTYAPFQPNTHVNLLAAASTLLIKAVLTGTSTNTPAVAISPLTLVSFVNYTSGIYTSRNMTFPANALYTTAKVYYDQNVPQGGTVTATVSGDNGVTWQTMTAITTPTYQPVAPAGTGGTIYPQAGAQATTPNTWQSVSYTYQFVDGSMVPLPTANFRVRLSLVSPDGQHTTYCRNLMATMR